MHNFKEFCVCHERLLDEILINVLYVRKHQANLQTCTGSFNFVSVLSMKEFFGFHPIHPSLNCFAVRQKIIHI